MWTPGPFESEADARVLLPDRRRSVVAARTPAGMHLRDYNHPTLWSISIHEVYSRALPPLPASAPRRVQSVASRRCSRAASFVEGWAHYCEEMMIEAGFAPAATERQARASWRSRSIRLARFIVCIRLHAEDMSVEQGMRFFRDEAFMEEASAPRSGARHVRSDVSRLQRRQADADEAAARLQAAGGEGVLAQDLPRHAAQQRHGAASGCTARSCFRATAMIFSELK